MGLKDHYRTLGIPSSASAQQVKQAFRTLAHKYHPDKNGSNEAATIHFREIQQAYFILSDIRRRKEYDEARYFAGLSSAKEPQAVSGQWLLQQALALSLHMQKVDSYTLNHRILRDYINQLLSEDHIAVLHLENDAQTIASILRYLLQSAEKLNYQSYQELLPALYRLAGGNKLLRSDIEAHRIAKKRKKRNEEYLPLILILIAIILCFFMYYYSKT